MNSESPAAEDATLSFATARVPALAAGWRKSMENDLPQDMNAARHPAAAVIISFFIAHSFLLVL
jgi:hypothetical protein